ncbi:hypothetical protein CAEBREN_29718 [Caenorhabditis brenneri]|uniref:Uncharacterized protein n=1 Tax=Caenorhabditis brenneri TaxID=135651 RepID=G0NP62_CAEBE|nr:hypothetical protein CAEBREN_29718 [Caenorhabditis brenneri]
MASQFANQHMNTAKQCRNHGYSTEALQQEEALSTLESTD